MSKQTKINFTQTGCCGFRLMYINELGDNIKDGKELVNYLHNSVTNDSRYGLIKVTSPVKKAIDFLKEYVGNKNYRELPRERDSNNKVEYSIIINKVL